MTGFGRAEMQTAIGTLRVEIKSVNNRFLETQFRLPRQMAGLEAEIKKEILKKISRGSLSVYLGWDQEENMGRLTWDKKNVENHVRVLREIAAANNLNDDLSISALMQQSDLIKSESSTSDEKTILKEIKPVMTTALLDFDKSRELEAALIIRDMNKMLAQISRDLTKISKLLPERIKKYRTDLLARIEKLVQGGVDEQRLATEVALMADRMDVSEECTRLDAHIEKFKADLKSDEPVGKRLSFLLQEMNREANTLGTKANDTEITHLAIGLKETLEKMREQVQNFE